MLVISMNQVGWRSASAPNKACTGRLVGRAKKRIQAKAFSFSWTGSPSRR